MTRLESERYEAKRRQSVSARKVEGFTFEFARRKTESARRKTEGARGKTVGIVAKLAASPAKS